MQSSIGCSNASARSKASSSRSAEGSTISGMARKALAARRASSTVASRRRTRLTSALRTSAASRSGTTTSFRRTSSRASSRSGSATIHLTATLASTISATPALYGFRELPLAFLPHLADEVGGIDAPAFRKKPARMEVADMRDRFRPQPRPLGLAIGLLKGSARLLLHRAPGLHGPALDGLDDGVVEPSDGDGAHRRTL